MTESDFTAALLTLKLATVTTVCLLILGAPLAWWLSRSHSWLQKIVSAFVSLPLILPPTVLGYYLLVFLGPKGIDSGLAFTFSGLVIGSILYSLPFVVQPLQNAFQSLGRKPLETAATLGLTPAQRFWSVVLPMTKNSFLTAAILGFAHTIGEFGVVLMMGGNIPGETRVLSIAIYDHVETLNYDRAGALSLYLLAFSLILLFALQLTRSKPGELA